MERPWGRECLANDDFPGDVFVLLGRFDGEETGDIAQRGQQHLSPVIPLAVEATFNTWAIVDFLTPFVRKIVVSNPLRTRAIADAKIKTDKVDALVLAQLLRLDYLPTVWIPAPPRANCAAPPPNARN